MARLGSMVTAQAGLDRLAKAHPDLQRVITLAADEFVRVTGLRFNVSEVERTDARQQQLVAAGASTTTHSRHVPSSNACGLACAADLAVIVGGQVRWDWGLYEKLADAVRVASIAAAVPMEWGGCWDRLMSAYAASAHDEMMGYVERKRAAFRAAGVKREPFIDGPHFQLAWSAYP